MLVGVTAVSAENVENDVLAASDYSTLSASGDIIYVDSSSTADDEQGTQDSPYKSISAAVNSDRITGGETIFIKNGVYSVSEKIAPAKSVSFVGESEDGVKITSTANIGIFEVVNSDIAISLTNLTFKDINSKNNLPVKVGGNQDIGITNCSFIDCASKFGAMQIYTSATATIENITIKNFQSTASAGTGGLYLTGSGTYNLKNCLIDGSGYSLSTGQMQAIVYLSSSTPKATANIEGLTISNCRGPLNSIIRSSGYLNIKNSQIVNNTVELSATGYAGEALIYNMYELNISQTVIENNVGPKNVIYRTSAAVQLVLEYCNIQNNTFTAGFADSATSTLNVENNYWGSNTLPADVSATVWVVEQDGSYKLSNGNPLEKDVPGLTKEEPTPTTGVIIYVDAVNGLDTNDGLTDATAVKTIEKAVNLTDASAEAGKIAQIILNEGTYIENPITITSDVIFTATGPVTWDANGRRALFVNNATVGLSGITFINGNETNAGAVIRQDYGIVTIDNCVFTNNGGENRQSLINVKSGTLIITNSVFDKNTAHKTSTSYGNINVNAGKLYIDNCNFTNNHNKYGVLYISSSQAEVYNSLFIGNNATSASGGSGAAIYVSGTATTQSSSSGTITQGKGSTLKVKNCEFVNNTAFGGTYYGGAGGALYINNNVTAVIEDSTFENNVAITGGEAGKGGSIYIYGSDVSVIGSSFVNNVAEEGAEIYTKYNGGSSYSILVAIDEINKLNIKDSVINNPVESKVVLDNSLYTIDLNQNYWGSNKNPSFGDVAIENWIVMDVTVSPVGAAVGDEVTIDVNINKVQHADGSVSSYAGVLPDVAVTVTSSSGNLNETIIVKDNHASTNYILHEFDNYIAVNNNTYAPLGAGIIYVSPNGNDGNVGSETSPVLTIAHAIEISASGKIVLLDGTYKTGYLGIISSDLNITGQGNVVIDLQNFDKLFYISADVNVVLDNVKIINGFTSTSDSGALIANSGNLTIINCTLANSTSGRNGGAIYNTAKLTVIDSIFANNKAGGNGGAIFAQGSSGRVPELSIYRTTFVNNSADGTSSYGGGAILAQTVNLFEIVNSTFISNHVKNSGGGAIELLTTDVATITGSSFIANTAKGEDSESNYGGGAISFIGVYSDKHETLTITDSLFEDNKVDGLGGGAIYVRASTVSVSGSVLIDNDDESGYAVYSRITSFVTPTINVNNNWWGSNDSPKSKVSYGVTLNSWAILSVSNSTAFVEGNTVVIDVNLNSYTTGTTNGTLAKPISVPRNITIGTSSGIIEGTLINGQFSTSYVVPAELRYVDVSVDSQKEFLFSNPISTNVEIGDLTANKGDRPVYVINVTSDSGIVNSGNVELLINNVSIANYTVVNGVVVTNKTVVSLPRGTYEIIAKYTDSDRLFEQSSAKATLTVANDDNYIKVSNFHNFFDENGIMYTDIPFTSLKVYDDLYASELNITNLVITAPISLERYGSSLYNISIYILSDNVTLKSLDLHFDNDETYGIYVNGAKNTYLTSVYVTFDTLKDREAYAIYVNGVDNLQITNPTINFNSNSEGTGIQQAVQISDSTNVLVSGGKINSKLPAFNVDYSQSNPVDQYATLAMGIQNSENVTIKQVKFTTDVTAHMGSFSTIDTLMANNVVNLIVSGNTITQNDQNGGTGYSYALDVNSCNYAQILNNKISVYTNTGVENAGAAYPIQMTGPYVGVLIDGNTLYAESKGPTLGIYSQNYYGATDLTVTNNKINVTGLASSTNNWGLVSGMELQDTVARVYNNTIYSQSTNAYTDNMYLFGISYAQWLYGDHEFDVRDNAVFTKGKYAVYFLNAVNTNVTNNNLHAYALDGDDAAIIKGGSNNVIRDNMPPYVAEIIINAPNAFKGNEYIISISVTNATVGNITLKVNNKEFNLQLVDGTVSQVVDYADLVEGAVNNVTVIYGGSDVVKSGVNNATFIVLDGVVTNATFHNYFDDMGYLLPTPAGVTLDFQGLFVGQEYSVYINAPVNVISSTKDAVFDTTSSGVVKFNVVAGGDYTNITGISIINGVLFVQGASYVTVDGIYLKANKSGVGSGTGFASIHSNAYYATVKNSYFENGGTGSSCLVLGKGGKYATFDNNTFVITGSSGNVLSSNIYVGSGDNPEFVNYTNNVINSYVAGSAFMYGITVCGQGNVIENNTLNNFKGNAIINQYGATSTKNVYRNNTITGGGSMAVGTYSLVENNNIAEGALTVTEGCIFVNNTAKSLSISGKNTVVKDNNVLTTVTIANAAQNTTLADNVINGLVTVNSKNNVISGNIVYTNDEFAIKLGTSSENNTISNNVLYANALSGNDAVSYDPTKSNVVEGNLPRVVDLIIDVDDIVVGDDAVINIEFGENINGTVDVIVGAKVYNVVVVDGRGQLIISGLSANDYSVSASFKETILIKAANTTAFTVSKKDASLSIEIGEVVIGGNVDVKVTAGDATGYVNIIVDGVEHVVLLENGSAVYTINNVAVGNHNIVAIYSGNDEYSADYAVNSFNVNKLSSSITITGNDVTVGQKTNIKVDLTDGATGFVLIKVNDVYFALNIATASELNIALPVGTYTVSASYNGDDTYESAVSNTINVVVKDKDPSFVQIDVEDVVAGENAVVNITVPVDATGVVSVIVDGVVVGNLDIGPDGKTKISLTDLKSGSHIIEVKYDGDDKYGASSSSKVITVSKLNAYFDVPFDFTRVAVDYYAGERGDKFYVVLKDENGNVLANKKVQIAICGPVYTVTTDEEGRAGLTINLATANRYTYALGFQGDDNYNAAPLGSTTLILNKKTTTIVASSVSFKSTAKTKTVTVKLTTTKNPYDGKVYLSAGKKITLKVNGKTYTAKADANGVAKFNIELTKKGTYNAVISFAGDQTYKASNKSIKVTIK